MESEKFNPDNWTGVYQDDYTGELFRVEPTTGGITLVELETGDTYFHYDSPLGFLDDADTFTKVSP